MSIHHLRFADAAEIVSPPSVESLAPKLYAHPGAGLAVVLTWDRAGARHALTVFDYRTVGRTIEADDGTHRKARIIDWSTFSANPVVA